MLQTRGLLDAALEPRFQRLELRVASWNARLGQDTELADADRRRSIGATRSGTAGRQRQA